MSEVINDDSFYVVKLRKAIKVGRTWLRPQNRNVMKGSALKELQEFVVSYELSK